MKALTFRGREKIAYETVADPEIVSSRDVIVKVHRAGICGSDLHPYFERERGLDHGTAMGHEFTGEIVETGRDVTLLARGEMVFSPFTTNCGNCFYCGIGLTCRCIHGQLFGWVEKGKGLHGAQAEFVRVPHAEATLMKIPDSIHESDALLLGDILSTGYFCAHQAGIQPGQSCAILGCGPVGLLAIPAARELGAGQVFAIDQIDARLRKAAQFGAEPIHLNRDNPAERIMEATEGRGVDAVMEVVGSESATRLALALVRPGGTISAVGVHTSTRFPISPIQAYDKNLTYKIGRCPARHFMEHLIPLVQSRKYDFRSIISHHMNLADGAEGYSIFAARKDNCTKVVLEIEPLKSSPLSHPSDIADTPDT